MTSRQRFEPLSGWKPGTPEHACRRYRHTLALLCMSLGVALWAGVAYGTPCDLTGALAQDRPRIGLVLGGGGARGAAHVGVLKVLEDMRIPVDCVAGTSMGAIVGGLYASGMRPDEIAKQLAAMDWDHIFDDYPPRPERPFRRKRDDDNYLVKKYAGYNDGKLELPLGWVHGQKFDLALSSLTQRVTGINDFDDLAIPFRAVATDIETGEVVVLSEGNLPRAIRASMSVPGAFDAVEVDGRLLVDGFVANNVPIDVVRAMGADIVIVVDVGTPLMKRDEITSMVKVLGQLSNILSQRNVQEQLRSLRETDVLIQPELGVFSASDFKDAATAIAIGQKAADLARVKLAGLAATPVVHEGYALNILERNTGTTEAPVITFVRFDNRSKIGDAVLAVPFKDLIGKPLDTAALQASIDELYGWDIYQNVRYDIVYDKGKQGLLIHVEEKSWGPDFLQFGIALGTNLNGDSTWNLGVSLLKTALNEKAGEVRILGQVGTSPLAGLELYQPLDVGLRYFVNPQLIYESRNFGQFVGDDQRSEYHVRRYGGGLSGGRVLGRWGELRVGFRRYTGEAEVRVGGPGESDFDIESAEAYARISYDTLDNRNWPRAGTLAKWEWVESVKSLGADDDFSQSVLSGGTVYSWGSNTVFGGGEFVYTAAGTPPVQNRTRAGGFSYLSGFVQDQLTGQQLVLLRSGYYRHLGAIEWLPVYAGFTLEYGNVFEDRNDISLSTDDALAAGSLFLGMDTILGPVYFSYGHAEGGENSVYLFLGRIF